MSTPLYNLKRTADHTGQSKSYIYKKMKDPDDPIPPFVPVDGRRLWRKLDLDAWIDRKALAAGLAPGRPWCEPASVDGTVGGNKISVA